MSEEMTVEEALAVRDAFLRALAATTHREDLNALEEHTEAR